MPMMPMEPAKDVRRVLAFFVFRLLKLRDKAVRNDIDAFPIFLWEGASMDSSSTSKGSESSWIFPSLTLTIRVA